MNKITKILFILSSPLVMMFLVITFLSLSHLFYKDYFGLTVIVLSIIVIFSTFYWFSRAEHYCD